MGWGVGGGGRVGDRVLGWLPHLSMHADSQAPNTRGGMGMGGREMRWRAGRRAVGKDYHDEDRTRDPLDVTIAWRDGDVVRELL